MRPKYRNIFQAFFYSVAFAFVIWFIFISLQSQNETNIVASVSLLIALVSLLITTFSFNQQLDSKLPQIVIDTDFKSRYGLMLLTIKNYGEKTAYNIEIKWNNPILNSKGVNIFSENNGINELKIPALQKGQEIKYMVDTISNFFSNKTDKELFYSGIIYHSLSRSKNRSFKNNFSFDLSVYRKTLYHETESLKAFYELQKLPKKLEELIDVIRNE